MRPRNGSGVPTGRRMHDGQVRNSKCLLAEGQGLRSGRWRHFVSSRLWRGPLFSTTGGVGVSSTVGGCLCICLPAFPLEKLISSLIGKNPHMPVSYWVQRLLGLSFVYQTCLWYFNEQQQQKKLWTHIHKNNTESPMGPSPSFHLTLTIVHC